MLQAEGDAESPGSAELRPTCAGLRALVSVDRPLGRVRWYAKLRPPHSALLGPAGVAIDVLLGNQTDRDEGRIFLGLFTLDDVVTNLDGLFSH